MSTISPSESQYYKELVTPFHPIGRLLVGTDLRDTQCDRFGKGNLRLVGYGDSSGGYAFSPKNQDAAIAPSLFSANLSNIANAIPRLTEVQDVAGKWIDTITLHALDEFIEQTTPQSFTENTFRIFCGGQKDYRGDGTGQRNVRNTFTLLAEIPIPALTRADVPRSLNVKVCVYIPPAQNIYVGLAQPQPYTCSFEMWDLQANTQVGSDFSNSIGGSPTVASGNDLNEDITNPSADTQFVLPIRFNTATWRLGTGGPEFPQPNVPPPSTVPPETPGTGSPSTDSGGAGLGSPTSSSSGSSPSSPSSGAQPEVPAPAEGGCVPVQNCSWHPITSAESARVDANLNNSTSLCPTGTVARGIIDFETSGSFVLCCSPDTFPPNNQGCSGIPATMYSCFSGGVCALDALGTYNTEAECLAARTRLYTISRSGGGNSNCSTQGIIDPNDSIPQVSPWTPPYSSSVAPGTTQPCGVSKFNVFDANGLIFQTTGYYTFYNVVDAGFGCP